jgi:hypothetical protein
MQSTSHFNEVNERLPLHGTSIEAANGIAENGFILPQKSSRLGKGVYFAASPKCSAKHPLPGIADKAMLVCKVRLGKMLEALDSKHNAQSEMQNSGCHSMHGVQAIASASGFRYEEFVIYNLFQALPLFIVNYIKFKQLLLSYNFFRY